MADASKIGQDWDEAELDAIVADHFAMLAAQQERRDYVKAHHNAVLRDRIGRTRGSVERKHQNISAVLHALHLPMLRGYVPLLNFQGALFTAVERFLDAHPAWLTLALTLPLIPAQAGVQAFSVPSVAESPTLFEERPPVPDLIPPPPRPAGLERLVRKWDPVALDFRNRALGQAGEAIVYHHERARLQAADRGDLAAKVRWVAREDGDGAGYDIRSYDPSGEERFLEVKTTYGARTTPFFRTRNEKGLAEAEPDRFRLYRLYDFAPQPKLFTLAPPLGLPQLVLEPETWRAGFG